MAVEITGSGYNSKVKLYNIHQGMGIFERIPARLIPKLSCFRVH